MTSRMNMRPFQLLRVPTLACVVLACTSSVLLTACDGNDDGVIAVLDVHEVALTDFDILLPVSGELAAQKQVEVRNRIEQRAVIKEIVPEGTRVKAGDVLVRLAREELSDKMKDAQDKCNTAESARIAAEQALMIKRGERASELEKAAVTMRIAGLALEGWRHGEVVSKRKSLEITGETATINHKRLVDRFNESAKLVESGYIPRDEYEKDRIAMIEAAAKVEQSKLDLEVYDKYTFGQEEAKKNSDLDQATAERGRVEQKFDAELVKAQADLDSAAFRVASERERLKNLEVQLESTTLLAPIDGLVVYATSLDSSNGGRGGGDAQPPQVGTELKPNELVILLPDTSRMLANLKVSEALSGRIKIGLTATVFSDAMPNRAFKGEVQSVSVLAANGGWRDPNRREYTVKVALTADEASGLKPAMRCKGEILLGSVTAVLTVPVQAVFRQGPVSFVYTRDGSGIAQCEVKLGRSSELQVEVLAGLAAGDEVLLREPLAGEVVAQLDPKLFEVAPVAETQGAPKRSSDAAAAATTSPAEGEQNSSRGGSGRGGRGTRPPSGEAPVTNSPTTSG
ncbi:MAG: HlyD family efflux transporter periplasmic adaptor subunit [Planctomycetota bacterium]|nr:MAG: HlyD family efflux transporter periplasmic adaptor subunit [Planctomycetota bacterium]RLS96322.1 MAG: HlyD family efflux transporter periplasmic adaptor subunit [Planctomycetota bacterium]